jgi:DNA-binding SARP family transcriptional activator
VEVRILGPLEVRDGDRVLAVTGAKQRALLAMLALHANEVVSSDRLLDELWDQEPPGSGATALQARISQLRKALGPAADRLVTESPGYVLRIDRADFDLYRFEHLLDEAEDADPTVAVAKLQEALGLWRGPALTDFSYERFAQAAIARLEELRVVATERKIDVELALGLHTRLVGELEGLVTENPLREAFRGQLMLALYRSGRQLEALEAYRAARRAFLDEFGLEPTPALQELERAILRQDDALELTEAAPTRSILVAVLDERQLEPLLEIAGPLARQPARELILARVVDERELGDASGALSDRRTALMADGLEVRVAAFASADPGRDFVRLSTEQDVDLLLLAAGPDGLDDPLTSSVLADAPCDVALMIDGASRLAAGPVLVPFAGAEHDWSAIEIGAWLARNEGRTLLLAGPRSEESEASRLLANASLAVQRALGVTAEPLLVDPGADALVEASADAALVVLGLPDRWRSQGLGEARAAIASKAEVPVVFVRHGLRPGGLAPPASYTRFTWSVR